MSVLALAGCSGCEEEKSSPAASAAAASELPPVPAPQGLAADILVPSPGKTWTRARGMLGVASALLPANFAMLVSTLVGLPPTTAEAIDPDVPATGALVFQEGEIKYVLGVHVRSGASLVADVTTGQKPRYQPSTPVEGLTLLTPIAGAAPTEITLAVSGNVLLIGQGASELKLAGPYVARTLPKRKMPKEALVVQTTEQALSGPVADALSKRWAAAKKDLEAADTLNRQKRGGRSPDFGDPAVAISGIESIVERAKNILASSQDARLVADFGTRSLTMSLTLTPKATGAAKELAQEMTVGNLAPLLELPASTGLGLLRRSGLEARKESAKDLADGLGRLLGDRLKDPEKERVRAALTDVAESMGDYSTWALSRDGGGAVLFRSQVTDEKRFDKGVRGLVSLLRVPAIAEPVKQFAGDFSVETKQVKLPGFDKPVQRALLTLKPGGMKTANDPTARTDPRPIELLWYVKDGLVHAAVAVDAVPVLAASLDTAKTLAANAGAKSAVTRAGNDASFGVLVNASMVGGTGNGGPVLLSFGKDSAQKPLVRLEADEEAVQVLMRSLSSGM